MLYSDSSTTYFSLDRSYISTYTYKRKTSFKFHKGRNNNVPTFLSWADNVFHLMANCFVSSCLVGSASPGFSSDVICSISTCRCSWQNWKNGFDGRFGALGSFSDRGVFLLVGLLRLLTGFSGLSSGSNMGVSWQSDQIVYHVSTYEVGGEACYPQLSLLLFSVLPSRRLLAVYMSNLPRKA